MAIYLDYNATTPLDPRVLAVMQPWLAEHYGNAASREHRWGWDAADAVEEARAETAALVGASPLQITFTSGATEALNLVIKGFAGYSDWHRKKLVTCATEHDAVLAPCRQLQRAAGLELEILPVDAQGSVDLDQLRNALRGEKQVLAVFAAANNEIGTLHPTRAIAELVHAAGAMLLVDLSQLAGRAAIDLHADGADFAAFSAHKLYGPKGVGALYVRAASAGPLEPLLSGGGQERDLRGGTLNVPGIVGFGTACRLAMQETFADAATLQRLRDRLEAAVLAEVPSVWINGHIERRICNTSSLGFKGVEARTLIRDMDDIAVATRAACSSGQSGPSHVLKALGLSDADAYACVRFSCGRFSTEADIDYAIGKVVASMNRLRHQPGD